MIRHIVLFKIKDFSSEEERKEATEKVLFNFRSLIGEIPQLRRFKVERDISRTTDSYDIIIDGDFDTPEDLHAYKQHPAHQYAVEQCRPWCSKKIVVDYESDFN
jgi:hypothetical protein